MRKSGVRRTRACASPFPHTTPPAHKGGVGVGSVAGTFSTTTATALPSLPRPPACPSRLPASRYVASNPSWASMARSSAVRVSCLEGASVLAGAAFNATCGPCSGLFAGADSAPYDRFDAASGAWRCPPGRVNTCVA